LKYTMMKRDVKKRKKSGSVEDSEETGKRRKKHASGGQDDINNKSKMIMYKKVRKGLYNLHNTCYISCALQVLASDPDLLEMILRLPSDAGNPGQKNKLLAVQLALLHTIKGAKATKRASKSVMENFCQAFDVNAEVPGDAGEYLLTLISFIQQAAKGTILEPEIERYFCGSGGKVNQGVAVYGGGGSLQQELEKRSSEKTELKEVPFMQVIAIGRNEFNREKMEMVRLSNTFTFPSELTPSMLYNEVNKDENFQLHAVVAHQYTQTNLPHYTLHVNKGSDWTHYNDLDIFPEIKEEVLEDLRGNPAGGELQPLATVIIYTSHTINPSDNIKMDVPPHITESYDLLDQPPEVEKPGCVVKLLYDSHITQNTKWDLIDETTLSNLKFLIPDIHLESRICSHLATQMYHQEPLDLHIRKETSVEQISVDKNLTFKQYIQQNIRDGGESVPEIRLVQFKFDWEATPAMDVNIPAIDVNIPALDVNAAPESETRPSCKVLIATKMFDPENKRFVTYGVEEGIVSQSVAEFLLQKYNLQLDSYLVSLMAGQCVVDISAETCIKDIVDKASEDIPVILVENKPSDKCQTIKEFVDMEINSFTVTVKDEEKLEHGLKICIKDSDDLIYSRLGEIIDHPADRIQLKCFANSTAVSLVPVTNLATVLISMHENEIPRIFQAKKLDETLKDLMNNKTVTYTIQVLQMNHYFHCDEKTEVEMKETDPTVEQFLRAVARNLKENLLEQDYLELVHIQRGKIIKVLPGMDRVSSHVKLQASCSGGSGASNLDLAVVRLAAQPAAAAHKGVRLVSCYTFKNRFFNMTGCPGLVVVPESATDLDTHIKQCLDNVTVKSLEIRQKNGAPSQLTKQQYLQNAPVLKRLQGVGFESILAIQI